MTANELRNRLKDFLDNPSKEDEFRLWFAEVLRDSHKNPDVESLAHEIVWAFMDQRRGIRTSAELMRDLSQMAGTKMTVVDLPTLRY